MDNDEEKRDGKRTEQENNRADKDVGASYLDHPCANDYHGD